MLLITHHHILEGFGDNERHAPVGEHTDSAGEPSHFDWKDLRHDEPRDRTPTESKTWTQRQSLMKQLQWMTCCYRNICIYTHLKTYNMWLFCIKMCKNDYTYVRFCLLSVSKYFNQGNSFNWSPVNGVISPLRLKLHFYDTLFRPFLNFCYQTSVF